MANATPTSPEDILRIMYRSPTRRINRMFDGRPMAPRKRCGDSPRPIRVLDEDLVIEIFALSVEDDVKVVFDKELRNVRLYIPQYCYERNPEYPRLLLTHKDWLYFYNIVWELYSCPHVSGYYHYQWEGEIKDMRYTATLDRCDIDIYTCWEKSLHDKDHFEMLNMRRMESERSLKDSLTTSDVGGQPPAEKQFLFECCKQGLHIRSRDISAMSDVFSRIDGLFNSN